MATVFSISTLINVCKGEKEERNNLTSYNFMTAIQITEFPKKSIERVFMMNLSNVTVCLTDSQIPTQQYVRA